MSTHSQYLLKVYDDLIHTSQTAAPSPIPPCSLSLSLSSIHCVFAGSASLSIQIIISLQGLAQTRQEDREIVQHDAHSCLVDGEEVEEIA